MLRLLGMDLRGHLDLLLLATLRDDGPAHGYAIIASLRERSLGAFDLPEGTVYPALYRLERDGLVDSEWMPALPAAAASTRSRRPVPVFWPGSQRCGAVARSPVFGPGVSQRIALQNLPEVPGKTTSSKCSVILGSGGSASLRRSRGLSAGVTSSR